MQTLYRYSRLVISLCTVFVIAATAVYSSSSDAAGLDGTTNLVGQVVDVNGLPIPDAVVLIYTAQPRLGPGAYCPSCYPDCGKHRTVDKAGKFTIAAVADWLTFRLYAVREGFEPAMIPNADPHGGAVKIVLKKLDKDYKDRHVVEGKVIGPDGMPVAGASVQPFSRMVKEGERRCGVIIGDQPVAITDQHGIYRFHPKNPGLQIFADFSARGLADRRFAINELSAAQNVTKMNVGTTVRGILTDASGRKLEGIQISAAWTETSEQCEEKKSISIATDDDGRFTIDNAPAQTAFGVFARLTSLAPKGLGTTTLPVESGVVGSSVDVAINALPTHLIRGKVVLEGNTQIPVSAKVSLSREHTNDVVFAEVGSTGDFVINGGISGGGDVLRPILRGYQLKDAAPALEGGLRISSSRIEDQNMVQLILVATPREDRSETPIGPSSAPDR